MKLTEPWSKKHKAVTKHGGLPHNLSNSFAQPLTMGELLRLTRARGDEALLALYEDHDLGYTPNGGSRDLREAIAELYGPSVGADDVVVFTGAQVALQTAALALVLNQPYNPAGTLLPKDVFASSSRASTASGSSATRSIACSSTTRTTGPRGRGVAVVARPRRTRIYVLWDRVPIARERDPGAHGAPREHAILEKNLAIIRENVALVDAFVAKYADHFEWVRPAGAIGFVKFKGPLTSTELGDELACAGISVKPAYCFTADADILAAHYGFRRLRRGEDARGAQRPAAFVEARFVDAGVV
ncbi:transferase [Aureococcus anophagefferens]|nr:transferase [Aureococcus anophagefferens]